MQPLQADALDPVGAITNTPGVIIEDRSYAHRSITPKRTEALNLLVPVCLSGSHVSCGTMRTEPVYMILGQAAGTAAAIAAREQLDSCRVEYKAINAAVPYIRMSRTEAKPRSASSAVMTGLSL